MESLYSSLYELLVQEFHVQKYHSGDIFPTVSQLCENYGVSSKTAKNALKQLRKDGYISTGSGQSTKVTFQQSDEEYEAYARQFFIERQGAFQDLFTSTILIQYPQMVEGACRLNEADFDELSRLADGAKNNDIVRFHYLLLSKLNNPLTLNLFREISLFEGYPLLYSNEIREHHDRSAVRKGLRDILAASRIRDRNRLESTFLSFEKNVIETISEQFRKRISSSDLTEGLPFIWRIYREHPQICYDLGSFLLHQILMGDYQDHEYLPSYTNLVDITGVPIISVRRTVGLLQKMGILQTVNGKGIRILTHVPDQNPPDLTVPAIRRNLAYFLQAFEMLTYSCEAVTLATIPHLSPQETSHLKKKLEEYLKSGRCGFSLFSYLLCMVEHCPLKAVREIYSKIYSLFLWGYPLINLPEVRIKAEQNFELLTTAMLQALNEKDAYRFARVLKEYTTHELPVTEEYLLHLGLRPEELRPSQPNHFLPPSI